MSKIIEARAIISGEDRLSKVIDGIGKKFKDLGKGMKTGANLDGLNRSLASTQKQLEAISRISGAQSKLSSAKYGLGGLKEQADRIAASLAAAKKAGDAGAAKDLLSQSRVAQRAVSQATSAIDKQAAAVRDARQAFNQLGVPVSDLAAHERRLKATIEQTTAAINKQVAADHKRQEMAEQGAARSAARRQALGGLAAGAGVLAAHKAKEIGAKAIEGAAEMDYGVRYQHIVTDVSEDDQNKILIPQAKRIGQETKFSNLDVVKAQTATMQSLPFKDPRMKAEVGASIVDQARNYAVIMESDMKEAAEGIRSFLQVTNKEISTKEKAVAESTRATNLIVKMSKLGGMNNEDAQQFVKYGFPTGTQVGLSDTTMGALGSVGRRSGLRGDELGVFARSAASKLVSPTAKGLDALTVAGIDYNKFSKMPGGLNTGNLENFGKRRFGKGFSEDQRGRISGLLENGEVVGNRDEFVKQVSDIVAESFDKKKDGKTKAQDAQKIAKMVGDFYKMSVESIDAEGLLRAILNNPKMTTQLKNAFFTDKHGGKAGILSDHMDQFGEDKKSLEQVTNEPTFAKDKAEYMTKGLGGAIDNLKGSFETLYLNIGTANTGLIKFAADGISSVADGFSNLSSTTQQILSMVGVAGAGAGGVLGTWRLVATLLGSNGAALTASATALDGSAAALTAAALKLGGSDVLKDLPGKAGKGVGRFGALGTLGVMGLGVGAIGAGVYAVDQSLPNANRMNGNGRMPGSPGAKPFMPHGWGAGYTDVSGGLGASGGSFVTNRPKTWGETLLGGQSVNRGGRDVTRMELPSFGAGGGAKQMPSGSITAEVKSLPPLTGEVTGTGTITSTIKVEPSQWLTATVTGLEKSVIDLRGKVSSIGSNGPGSTGKSSPDAGKGGKD